MKIYYHNINVGKYKYIIKKENKIEYMQGFNFIKLHSFEKRLSESKRILAKYPDRIPVICERNEKSTLPAIKKNKYLVPRDLTLGQFRYIIRKRVQISPERALFIFINNTLPLQSETIEMLYNAHHNDDGFMYIRYSDENTFG